MSRSVRLTLVSHAMTDAMSAGRFPLDEPLNALGIRQVSAARTVPADAAVCGPERRTRETAELLGLSAGIDARLADFDHGRWRGESLERLDPAEVVRWLDDPESAPHGGESLAGLVSRVTDWLSTLTGASRRIIAVTHPAVIRAAVLAVLDAPPKSFWRIDIAPVSQTVLHHRGSGWTLRADEPKPAAG
jgi:broad specificity phosphatase PhoE